MKKILLALGGNALGNNPKEQEELTRRTSKSIVDLIEAGHQVVVSHGNGPQVGMINLALETDEIPLAECIAMSQGYIGYHLEKSIREELESRAIDKEVTSLITQVLVDAEDEAFKNPSKPIGRFYGEDELEEARKKYLIKKDSNRGYRRFVASPRPKDILEKEVIKDLIDKGHVVIAGGGGGVPLVKNGLTYESRDGVIDKDFTSSLLSDLLDLDYFIILTQVDKVYINFGREDQKALDKIKAEDLAEYIEAGEFGEGSMLPKIEASIEFVKSAKDRRAIITSIDKVKEGIKGESGTHIF